MTRPKNRIRSGDVYELPVNHKIVVTKAKTTYIGLLEKTNLLTPFPETYDSLLELGYLCNWVSVPQMKYFIWCEQTHKMVWQLFGEAGWSW